MIDKILKPLDCRARNAVSLPAPGPFNLTVKTFNPCSWAFVAAWSAAICAAYGVDFRDPLKPLDPAEDQAITFPLSSAIVTIVLLNVALTKAIPVVISFFIFFFLVFTFFIVSTFYFGASFCFLSVLFI